MPLKPAAIGAIDWSNPLTDGLVYAALMNERGGVPWNAIRKPSGAVASTGISWTNTQDGPALFFDSSSSGYFDTGDNWGIGSPGALSVVCRPRHDNLTFGVTETYACTRPTSSAGWVFAAANGTGASPNRTFKTQLVFGGVVAFGVSSAISGGDATPITIGFSCVANNASGLNYYAAGQNIGTVSTAAKTMRASSQDMVIGRDLSSANPLNGAMEFFFAWNRALSDTEHAEIANDPYQIFRRPSLWYLKAATSGATTKTLTGGFIAGASFARHTNKQVSATFVPAAHLMRHFPHRLAASFAANFAGVTHKAGQLLTLTASFAAHAVVVRRVKKNLSARQTVSVALVRRINKKLTASRVVTAAVSRRFVKKLAAAATWAATQTNNAGVITKLLTASFTASGALARKISLTFHAPVAFKMLLAHLINTHWIKAAASSATWAAQSAGSAVWTKISGNATAWTKQ